MPAFYYALIFSIIGLVSDGCADASRRQLAGSRLLIERESVQSGVERPDNLRVGKIR